MTTPPADTTTQPPAEPPVTGDDNGTEDDTEEFDPARAKAKIAKVNAEAKSLRERLRKAEEAERKLAEIEDANKSEVQKMQERLAAAEKAAAESNRQATLAKVAASKKLPPSLADRLRGETVEEMEADADALLADLGTQFVAKTAAGSDATGAGVVGKPGSIDAMSPAEIVKATRERHG